MEKEYTSMTLHHSRCTCLNCKSKSVKFITQEGNNMAAGRFDNVDLAPNMLRQIMIWKQQVRDILRDMVAENQITTETPVSEVIGLINEDINSLRSRLGLPKKAD